VLKEVTSFLGAFCPVPADMSLLFSLLVPVVVTAVVVDVFYPVLVETAACCI